MTRRELLNLLLGQATIASAMSAEVHEDTGGIAWEADDGVSKIFLLGTIHAMKADCLMPSFVEKLYQAASSIFLEFNPVEHSLEASKKIVVANGLLPIGDNLQNYLTARQQAFLQKFLRTRPHLSATLLQQKLWLAAMTLQNTLGEEAGFNTLYGVESYFSRRCVHDGKPLRLLEKVETPILALSSLPLEVQKNFFSESLQLADGDNYATLVEHLYNKWRERDHRSLTQNLSEDLMIPEIYDSLILKRNSSWVDLLLKSKNLHKSLICIGLQHLYGKSNLASLLKKRGFNIKLI